MSILGTCQCKNSCWDGQEHFNLLSSRVTHTCKLHEWGETKHSAGNRSLQRWMWLWQTDSCLQNKEKKLTGETKASFFWAVCSISGTLNAAIVPWELGWDELRETNQGVKKLCVSTACTHERTPDIDWGESLHIFRHYKANLSGREGLTLCHERHKTAGEGGRYFTKPPFNSKRYSFFIFMWSDFINYWKRHKGCITLMNACGWNKMRFDAYTPSDVCGCQNTNLKWGGASGGGRGGRKLWGKDRKWKTGWRKISWKVFVLRVCRFNLPALLPSLRLFP